MGVECLPTETAVTGWIPGVTKKVFLPGVEPGSAGEDFYHSNHLTIIKTVSVLTVKIPVSFHTCN